MILHILSGLPGSGKSTYIQNTAKPTDTILSRDEWRIGEGNEQLQYSYSKLMYNIRIKATDSLAHREICA